MWRAAETAGDAKARGMRAKQDVHTYGVRTIRHPLDGPDDDSTRTVKRNSISTARMAFQRRNFAPENTSASTCGHW
jgi:hypothetical protein